MAQRLPNTDVRRGDPITAQFLNALVDKVFRTFISGPGIAIRRLGTGQVCIESTQPFRRGGGSGHAEITAEDRATLEGMTLPEGAWCRTTGAIKRAYRYLDGVLICYTHTETS